MKKIIIAIIVVVIIGLGYWALVRKSKQPVKQQPNASQTQNSGAKEQTKAITTKEADNILPKALPQEKNVEVVETKQVATEFNSTLTSKEYISEKTIVENIAEYKESLEKDGWKTSMIFSQENRKILEGIKGLEVVHVSSYLNQDNKIAVKIELLK